MHLEEELSLIKEAIAGDHHAFRLLVEHHQGFAYALARRFIGDEDEAEDIVQDAFIRLWKSLRKYNPEYKLKSWLGKIVTNLCLDHIKARKRKIEVDKTNMALMVPDKQHHETELEGREFLSIVTKLSLRLTEKQQAVFVLRDLEQLSSDEVCEILGMSSGNLKSNLYYARVNIRDGLRKYYKQKRSPDQDQNYQTMEV